MSLLLRLRLSLACVALAFMTLLPTVATLGGTWQAGAGVDWAALDGEVCAFQGASADGGGAGHEAPGSAHLVRHCAACLVVAHLAVLPAHVAGTAPVLSGSASTPLHVDTVVRVAPTASLALARAPPTHS